MPQSKPHTATEKPQPHRRMAERTINSIAGSAWFKLLGVAAQVIVAVGLAFGAFAWNSLQKDIQDIKSTMASAQRAIDNYNGEKLAIQNQLTGFADFQRETLGLRRLVFERLATLETKQERMERDISDLRRK